ncbi:hypothetical protein [Pantoea vagans]|uniref:hypothetical protein n=1 Tax=Pantoea vagans TaxID=470934 RepID=UPI003671AFC5
MSLSLPIHYLNHGLRLLFGMHQKQFCSDWDALLNQIIDSGKIVEHGDCTITFVYAGRKYQVWTANEFYSYGNIWQIDEVTVDRKFQRRPSLNTMLRLHELKNKLANGDFQNFKRAMTP